MIGKRPDISLRGAAPGVDQVAFGIELENRRCSRAAFPGRGFGIEAGFGTGGERWESTVDDEHVILRIDSHADGRAKDPVVRERFGPEGVHLEGRRIHRLALGGFQHGLANAECQNDRNQRSSENQRARVLHSTLLVAKSNPVPRGAGKSILSQ